MSIGAVVFPVRHNSSIRLVQHLAEFILLVPLVWLGLRFLRGGPQVIAVPAST